MKISTIAAFILGLVCLSLSLSGCVSQADSQDVSHAASESKSESHEHVIVVTSPVRKDVISTQPYVCQIHSCQHIEVRALEGGYLEKILVKEGQAVKKGELMFKILPVLYQARLESESAEVKRLQIELDNAQALMQKGYVAAPQIALKQAEVAKAEAKLNLAKAELSFTNVTAPFDGIVDRQRCQQGSLIQEGDILTTFSDNSLMWVYFNVPEKNYLAYKAELDLEKAGAKQNPLQIELKLANGQIFPQPGKIGAIEADFNNTTGNISFRADFPNPDGLLRNGQTGTILIHTSLKDVVVIPQRATFEILARRYAYVVDKDNVVHQRDITIQSAQDDIFVIQEGLDKDDKIILEGIRQVRDGDKIEYEFRAPEEVLDKLKYHAE
jgi:membrane fusion protein (multidrug efflux system)